MIIISSPCFSLFKKKINKQGQARGIKTVPQTFRCVSAFSARFMNIQEQGICHAKSVLQSIVSFNKAHQ